MFEGVLSDIVLKICADYVQDINKEQLNISVWSGKSTAFHYRSECSNYVRDRTSQVGERIP